MRIDIIYFDVTSGHRSAALALEDALLLGAEASEVRVVNLVDILGTQWVLRAIANAGIDFFNWGVRQDLALLPEQQIALFQTIARALPPAAHRAVARFWQDRDVDVVASVVPICNRLLEQALHHARPNCPYVVIPVDFAEGRRDYWFDARSDAYYLCPTSRLMAQAAAAGVRPERTIRVSGMPVDPAFYDLPSFERDAALADAGLAPEHPTVLVCFGGQGSRLVERCANYLRTLGARLNVIFLCGRHDAVRRRVTAMDTPYRKRVLGFSPEPPARHYASADVVVGKPGSMTLTEALVMRKPLVAVTSTTLAVVQRGNEAWLRETGVGDVVDLPHVAEGVRRALRRPGLAAVLDTHWHRGVFEIRDKLITLGSKRATA